MSTPEPQTAQTAGDALALGAGRPRPPHKPIPLKCESCGASLSIKNERTELVVCDYCGSHLAVTQTEQKVLGAGPEAKWSFPIALGERFRHKGALYEVLARMVYIEDGDPSEATRQYLLYHPRRGTLWLDEYGGHYSIGQATHVMPAENAFMKDKGEMIHTADKRKWVCQEKGEYQLAYVDGALPWVATVGDRIDYAEFVDAGGSGQQYDVQQTGREIEYGTGEPLTREQIVRGFGRTDIPVSGKPAEDASKKARAFKQTLAIALVFVLTNGLLLAFAYTKGSEVLAQRFSANQITGETFSKPFTVRSAGTVLKVEFDVPKLANAWMALDWALVEGDDAVVHADDADISYYSGGSGDDSWSEGSKTHSAFVRVPEAGTYKLLVHAISNWGENEQATRAEHDLTVRVRAGALRSIYFVVAAIFSAVVLVLTGVSYSKWKKGDEDDD